MGFKFRGYGFTCRSTGKGTPRTKTSKGARSAHSQIKLGKMSGSFTRRLLVRPIDWKLIARFFDEVVKYATAIKTGTTRPEIILRRFARSNNMHPTYRALAEFGRAIKTIFACRYLRFEEFRREIQEGLNVMENWNSATNFVYFGRGGEITSNRKEDQEIAVQSLHLLQNCMVYVNTQMYQSVLSAPAWRDRMSPEDFRGITPLIYNHVKPTQNACVESFNARVRDEYLNEEVFSSLKMRDTSWRSGDTPLTTKDYIQCGEDGLRTSPAIRLDS